MTISLPPGAVRIDLEEGISVFRASTTVQSRIEELLAKQQSTQLSAEEEKELERLFEKYLAVILGTC
ncbi:MAG: hypothetical protein V7K68_06245 [Nostoc sp.]|uniref:hypothetical protein n=1 Tax=Nostoc sp. TaxID=1180 RepID=UPI002FFBBD43